MGKADGNAKIDASPMSAQSVYFVHDETGLSFACGKGGHDRLEDGTATLGSGGDLFVPGSDGEPVTSGVFGDGVALLF